MTTFALVLQTFLAA